MSSSSGPKSGTNSLAGGGSLTICYLLKGTSAREFLKTKSSCWRPFLLHSIKRRFLKWTLGNVQRIGFRHRPECRRFFVSDTFSPTGNTLFGLSKVWHLGKACSRQVHCRNHYFAYSTSKQWQRCHQHVHTLLVNSLGQRAAVFAHELILSS